MAARQITWCWLDSSDGFHSTVWLRIDLVWESCSAVIRTHLNHFVSSGLFDKLGWIVVKRALERSQLCSWDMSANGLTTWGLIQQDWTKKLNKTCQNGLIIVGFNGYFCDCIFPSRVFRPGKLFFPSYYASTLSSVSLGTAGGGGSQGSVKGEYSFVELIQALNDQCVQQVPPLLPILNSFRC